MILPLGPLAAEDYKAGALTVEQPWSRATPPGAATAAGYLTIRNTGDTPDRLVAATADVAGKVTAHSMTMDAGVMKMRELPEGVAIPAHGVAALKPSGMHLMFEGLKHPLKKGESVAGTLVFEKAGTLPVTFTIQSIGAAAPQGDMKGMKMD